MIAMRHEAIFGKACKGARKDKIEPSGSQSLDVSRRAGKTAARIMNALLDATSVTFCTPLGLVV